MFYTYNVMCILRNFICNLICIRPFAARKSSINISHLTHGYLITCILVLIFILTVYVLTNVQIKYFCSKQEITRKYIIPSEALIAFFSQIEIGKGNNPFRFKVTCSTYHVCPSHLFIVLVYVSIFQEICDRIASLRHNVIINVQDTMYKYHFHVMHINHLYNIRYRDVAIISRLGKIQCALKKVTATV